MKSFKIIITLVILYLPYITFAQETYAIAENYPIENESYAEDNLEAEAVIKQQEYQLVEGINNALVEKIEYPLEARENGNEALIRAVVIFNADHSTSELQIAKGNLKSFNDALTAAYNQLDFQTMVPQNYKGKKSIPVKILFELD